MREGKQPVGYSSSTLKPPTTTFHPIQNEPRNQLHLSGPNPGEGSSSGLKGKQVKYEVNHYHSLLKVEPITHITDPAGDGFKNNSGGSGDNSGGDSDGGGGDMPGGSGDGGRRGRGRRVHPSERTRGRRGWMRGQACASVGGRRAACFI